MQNNPNPTGTTTPAPTTCTTCGRRFIAMDKPGEPGKPNEPPRTLCVRCLVAAKAKAAQDEFDLRWQELGAQISEIV